MSIVFAFAFLFLLRGGYRLAAENPQKTAALLIKKNTDLFFTTLVAAAVFDVLKIAGEIYAWLLSVEIFLPFIVIYVLASYQKKSALFFLISAGLFFYGAKSESDFLIQIVLVFLSIFFMTVFQIVFIGLKYRLLFLSIPKRSDGWPALCLLAAGIAVVFESLRQLIF